MQHPPGWHEESTGDAPYMWWNGDRWVEQSSSRPTAKTVWQPALDDQAYDRGTEGKFSGYRRTERSGDVHVDHSARDDDDDRRNLEVTLALSGLFAISLLIILAGYGLDNVMLRLGGVLGVLFFGVGAIPLKIFRKVSLTVRLALSVLIGISVPTLVASVMALTPFWHPLIAAVLLGIVVLILHVMASWDAFKNLYLARRPVLPTLSRNSWLNPSTGLTVAGTLCWAGAAGLRGHVNPGIHGFLAQISPLWYVGLLLVLVGIILARDWAEFATILGIVSLVAALTITPALAYDLPRITTAAKHVGYVQQLLGAHSLNRQSGIYDAYSGFFALGAWVCDIAGMKDSWTLATYWPCIIDITGLAVLRLFFAVVLRSTYRIYIALALTFLVDVVGQDYFSPQSVGYILVFGIYALSIGAEQTNLGDRTRTGLILVISCALAVTHELSPYICAVALTIFVIAKIVRPVHIPLLVGLPAILWALLNRTVLSGYINISDLGDFTNFEPPKTAATPGLQRLPIVGQTSEAALVGVIVLLGLAIVGFLAAATRLRGWNFFSPTYAWTMLISTGTGLALIVANPYGNEGIFRAVLFAIPWLAAFAVTSVPCNAPRWMAFPSAMLLISLMITYCISSFGLDNANVIRSGDVQALDFYKSKASSNSYILNLSYGDIPTAMLSPASGHTVNWTAVVPQSNGLVITLNSESARLLARNYLAYVDNSDGDVNALYAIWSPASVSFAVDYGLESTATATAWEKALSSNSDWKLVYADDGTYLFQLVA